MGCLDLPFPPSSNNLFATFRNRRIRTRRYEAWLADAGASVMEQRPEKVAGPFFATITLVRPDRRKRDLDGLAKAPLDLLVKHGIIEDDSLATSIHLIWSSSPPVKGGECRVIVSADYTDSMADAA